MVELAIETQDWSSRFIKILWFVPKSAMILKKCADSQSKNCWGRNNIKDICSQYLGGDVVLHG